MVNFIHYFGYLELGYMEFPLIWDILTGTNTFLVSGIVCIFLFGNGHDFNFPAAPLSDGISVPLADRPRNSEKVHSYTFTSLTHAVTATATTRTDRLTETASGPSLLSLSYRSYRAAADNDGTRSAGNLHPRCCFISGAASGKRPRVQP